MASPTHAPDNVSPILVDWDGDGHSETTYVVDSDNDGIDDTAFIDVNDDGIIEMWAEDTDLDGDFDTITIDADGDGVPEETLTNDSAPEQSGNSVPVSNETTTDTVPVDDPNGSGQQVQATVVDIDEDGYRELVYEADVNDDGVSDTLFIDDEADGTFEYALHDSNGDGEFDFEYIDHDGDGIYDEINDLN